MSYARYGQLDVPGWVSAVSTISRVIGATALTTGTGGLAAGAGYGVFASGEAGGFAGGFAGDSAGQLASGQGYNLGRALGAGVVGG